KVGFNLDTTDGGNGNGNGGSDESSTGSSNDGSALGGFFGIIAALAATLGLGALFSGAVDQHLPSEIKNLRDQIRAFFSGQL
ncbi:MAG: hypothetical protein ACTHU4_06045, partial [Corynebacterium casei]